MTNGCERAKRRMLEHDLRSRGITDERVLHAIEIVDRARFVPPALAAEAYDDNPVPIGFDQTISQPYIVAYMLQELELEMDHTVLEVGAGSGYVVALLSRLCRRVVGTDRIPELVELARKNLHAVRLKNHRLEKNYELLYSPEVLGSPDHAPFDRILVSATAPRVPQVLVDQLAEGGIMVIPVGGFLDEWLCKAEKLDRRIRTTRLLPVRFVPLRY